MLVKDIPALSLAVLKHNLPNYDTLTDSEIVSYLDTRYDVFKVPKLTDEDKAVSLIEKVIKCGGFILGCSDYDSDGINSAAVINKALKGKSSNYAVIHNKRCNGNGFNPVFVDRIKRIHDKKPISLIITADHGSSNRDELKELKDYGIKHILLTDHHDIPKDKYPDTVDVFINPQKVVGDPVGMCGCYVVFKILSNLYRDDPDIYNNLYVPCLPHVAIATVTDVMSLALDYNRTVVRAGLQIINTSSGLWSVLADKLGTTGKFYYKDIGFKLGPFINTGNRVSREELFYHILIESDISMLTSLVEEGVELNTNRKGVRKQALVDAVANIVPSEVGNSLAIMIDTTMSINGIIAGNVGELYNVPVTCFMKSNDGKILTGSARAIVDHVSIVDVFNAMKIIDNNLFIGCGGHKGAGGCSIPFDKLPRFKELFEEVISAIPKPTTEVIDKPYLNINTKYLTPGMVDDIDYAGPFGKDWDIPLVCGVFKIVTMIAMKTMAIVKLITPSGLEISGTYFYKDGDTKLSIEDKFYRGVIIEALFELQYYKRYHRTNFTILISTITEK